MALLTTTTFPELVDSVEICKTYKLYDIDEMNNYLSGFYVLLFSLGSVFGTFFGNFIVGLIGYELAFVVLGLMMWGYTLIYALLCGLSDLKNEVEIKERLSVLNGSFGPNEVELKQRPSVI